MKHGITRRRLNYVSLLVGAIGTLYTLACLNVLSRLEVTSLVAVYVLSPNSPESPVTFPMPGLVIDIYWSMFGRDRVFRENEGTNDYVKFLNSVIAPTKNLSPYSSLDMERAQNLLTQLVCAKQDNKLAMEGVKEFQREWSSQPLSTAIQRCEQ